MQIRLTTTLLFGAAALMAGGCAPFTNGTSGGSSGGCVASITEDDPGAQVAINTPGVALGAGTGSTNQLAEAFLVTSTQTVPEVAIKLDVVAPSGTQVTSTITAQIQQDALIVTSGNATAPTTPGIIVNTSGITATGTLPAGSVANTLNGSAAFYDICFPGAIGVNCPTPGVGTTTSGVTLNAGQFYWITVTTNFPGTSTSFVEWRGTKSTTPDFFGYVFLNGLNWLPINGANTSNANFDFKLGC